MEVTYKMLSTQLNINIVSNDVITLEPCKVQGSFLTSGDNFDVNYAKHTPPSFRSQSALSVYTVLNQIMTTLQIQIKLHEILALKIFTY